MNIARLPADLDARQRSWRACGSRQGVVAHAAVFGYGMTIPAPRA